MACSHSEPVQEERWAREGATELSEGAGGTSSPGLKKGHYVATAGECGQLPPVLLVAGRGRFPGGSELLPTPWRLGSAVCGGARPP